MERESRAVLPNALHAAPMYNIELEYILLAPHFVREVLEIYEGWKGKESVPLKVQELMMVLQIEADQLHR